MGNRAHIDPTKFVGLNPDGSENPNDVEYGILVYDEALSFFHTVASKDALIGKTPRQLYDMAKDALSVDVATDSFIDDARSMLDGVYIGNQFHTWKDLGF